MCYFIHNKDKYKVPKEPKHARESNKYIKDRGVSMSINMIPPECDHGRGIVKSEIWYELGHNLSKFKPILAENVVIHIETEGFGGILWMDILRKSRIVDIFGILS